jgi:hypothetical protein
MRRPSPRRSPAVASVSWFALDSRTKTADAIAAINATRIVVTGRDSSLVLAQLGVALVGGRTRPLGRARRRAPRG